MAAKTMVSVEQFDLLLEDGEFRYDLDEGELITMTRPRARHSLVEGNLYFALRSYLEKNPVGKVFNADILYVLGKTTKRAPDVSVLLRPLIDPDQEIQGAPEIVVEILSPSNRHVDLKRKLGQFFSTGCKLAWVVDPAAQTVEVWESAEGPERVLPKEAALETPLLPGFSCQISKLF
jgi:Uma2 family endonuclease